MKKIALYSSQEIDTKLDNLVDQINLNNKQLHTSIVGVQEDTRLLGMILKSALGQAGQGEDGDTVLAMAVTLATLSQRVALLEAKANNKARR